MINKIENKYTNIVAFEFSGEVTKDEFDQVIIPQVEGLIEKVDKINLVYVLNTELKNFTAGAWWEDAMLGLGNLTKWHKSAIVTDNENIQKFTDAFSVVMPGEFKGFDKNQLEEALKWASIE